MTVDLDPGLTPERLSRARLISAHITGNAYAKSGTEITPDGIGRPLSHNGRLYMFISQPFSDSEEGAPRDVLLINRMVFDWKNSEWSTDLGYTLDPEAEQVAQVTDRTHSTLLPPLAVPGVLGAAALGPGRYYTEPHKRENKPVTNPDEVGFIENLTIVAAKIMASDA